MPTYEMFWDCRSCDTKKLLGKTHRHCPHCGQVQDPSWRYFPSEDEKVAVEDHVFVGVDWVCERCDSPNSASATHCVNCGDARDGVEKDVERKASVRAGQQSGERDRPERVHPSAQGMTSGDEAVPAATSSWKGAVPLLAAGLFLLVVCCGLLAFFWTEETEATVTGHTWSRSVHIERLQATSGGSWCDSMPGDAYGVSRSRRERSTRQIPDGESCSTVNVDNGDGTFSTQQSCHTVYRSEPVYDDWCSYTVDRWQHHDTVTASGASLASEPRWPSVSVSGCHSLGCTRQGARGSSYIVHLLDADGDEQTCDFDQSTWASMPVGSRWTVAKRVLLDNLVCSDFEPVETP